MKIKIKSLHKLIRDVQLSEGVREVVFDKGSLKHGIGSVIHLTNTDSPLYLASGLQEVWLRFLYDSNKDMNFNHIAQNSPIILKGEYDVAHHDLPPAIEDSIFIVQGIKGISLALSYLSTYPMNKPDQIFYISDSHIQKDWLEEFHEVVFATELTDELIIDQDKQYYIMGDEEYSKTVSAFLKENKIPKKNIHIQ